MKLGVEIVLLLSVVAAYAMSFALSIKRCKVNILDYSRFLDPFRTKTDGTEPRRPRQGFSEKLSAYKDERKKRLQEAKKTSLWSGILLGVFSAASFPLGFPQFLWVGNPQTMRERNRVKSKIDFWILIWALITPACLFLLVPAIPVFAIVPVLRLFDIFYVLLWLLISPLFKPQRIARSATFLLLHYIEIVMIFACVFLAIQKFYPTQILFKTSDGCLLTSWTALYFSLVTAATVGYGDITPLTPLSQTMVALEFICVLFLVAIDIPYVLSGRDTVPPAQSRWTDRRH
jgi:hypothetical protein